jgi:hypothetical protein
MDMDTAMEEAKRVTGTDTMTNTRAAAAVWQ